MTWLAQHGFHKIVGLGMVAVGVLLMAKGIM